MPMSVNNRPKPLVLCILDGWGHAENTAFNAITLAKTPTWDKWNALYPQALLEASGKSVGLPSGQMGNSEVGHMTIGAGRPIMQDLPRISTSIKTGEFFEKESLRRSIEGLKKMGGFCHVMGLLSPGGVHSHQEHLFAIVRLLASEGIGVKIHAFLDGRDAPPQSALHYYRQLLEATQGFPNVQIATVMGRYYGMDRDNRWDRTQKAFEAIACGVGQHVDKNSMLQVLDTFYNRGVTDEFIPPLVVDGYDGVHTSEGLFMTNFRADRVRQILRALILPDFNGFERQTFPNFSIKLAMTDYAEDLSAQMEILFPPFYPPHTLGDVVSAHHLLQLRVAETEKYAHVTFFFNGGIEKPLPGEQRCLVPSPKVDTYDLQPEMAADMVTDKVLKAIQKDSFDIIIVNYANTDMVGHTGKLKPTIEAVETVDRCLGILEEVVLQHGGTLIVTADHGNAEVMMDQVTHHPYTAHTTNKVPFVIVGKHYTLLRKEGTLADVAPTVLRALHLPIPAAMMGESLIA